MSESKNSFNSKQILLLGKDRFTIFGLDRLKRSGFPDIDRLPITLRILLENLLRMEDGKLVRKEDIEAVAGWRPRAAQSKEIAFMPARVILQDFTGVPAVVDLAAMRDAVKRLGGDPKRINPLQRADLVIDHSIQVDVFGRSDAFQENARIEFERNRERYEFLKWGQQSFDNFSVVPPNTGIVHQVNLEYLASVVFLKQEGKEIFAYPDTLVGTDSHTTMINGLGIMGWGVGGIEAEAVMLGQPVAMVIPEVIGFKLIGKLREGVTATDLVLTITEVLRKKGVVGKFVEFFGSGLAHLNVANRATLANMAPEYGATMGYFPIDDETLRYLQMTGRDAQTIELVEAYAKAQGLFRVDDGVEPEFSDLLELDLGQVEPSMAGPKRPQDRISLPSIRSSLVKSFPDTRLEKKSGEVSNGSVVIAAITSCTNTSNPEVMIGAGLVAKKAVLRGLNVKPWVKTSLAPGSKVVVDYLAAAGLLEYLEKINFHLVGFGCTTCIGNSGPLPEEVTRAIQQGNLVAASVLSGNRNFEGRINALVKANYLASPPLVVAFALAGTVDIDLTKDPIGNDSKGVPVFLRDIWPTNAEILEAVASVTAAMYRKQYAHVYEGDVNWKGIQAVRQDTYAWNSDSSYIKNPPFFQSMGRAPDPIEDIKGARMLAMLGDSITTDHISPAGSIAKESPAGRYLISLGIGPKDFNSYGARRGNFEVMVRGTFANIRLKNELLAGVEGGWTRHFPDGTQTSIYEAAMQYQAEGCPLIIVAGKEYGSGSSRDWAAKGPALLGIRAVLAESFERIHRSNLIGMGILPLQFLPEENRRTFGFQGDELFDIVGIKGGLTAGQNIKMVARKEGQAREFTVLSRLDTQTEVAYYQNGGILPFVLRQIL